MSWSQKPVGKKVRRTGGPVDGGKKCGNQRRSVNLLMIAKGSERLKDMARAKKADRLYPLEVDVFKSYFSGLVEIGVRWNRSLHSSRGSSVKGKIYGGRNETNGTHEQPGLTETEKEFPPRRADGPR